MRYFSKSKKMEGVGYDIRGPVLEEADRMIAKGISVLKLNTGNPAPFGFLAPDSVIEALINNLQVAEGYSDSRGLLEARQAIVDYCKTKGIPNVGINDVYTGNGVSELISITMQALLNPGDEILIPTPDYPLWTSCATLAGGKVVHYFCDESNDWLPDVDDIRRKVSAKTKAMLIINPNNPTGALYPKDLLEEMVEVARQNDLMLFSDEIYDRLLFDGLTHTSTAALAPDMFCVTLNGLSKSHMVAGFRCGWMCLSGRKEIAGDYVEGLRMLASMRLCSNVPSQAVIKAALDISGSADVLLEPGGRLYEQREFIYNAINVIPGLSAVKPKAALYLFPKIDIKKFNIHNDEQFVLDFLKAHHILITHGRGYYWPEPDHFRIIYLPEVEQLRRVTDSLRQFLSSYHQ